MVASSGFSLIYIPYICTVVSVLVYNKTLYLVKLGGIPVVISSLV